MSPRSRRGKNTNGEVANYRSLPSSRQAAWTRDSMHIALGNGHGIPRADKSIKCSVLAGR
jgi:hypothetical protein